MLVFDVSIRRQLHRRRCYPSRCFIQIGLHPWSEADLNETTRSDREGLERSGSSSLMSKGIVAHESGPRMPGQLTLGKRARRFSETISLCWQVAAKFYMNEPNLCYMTETGEAQRAILRFPTLSLKSATQFSRGCRPATRIGMHRLPREQGKVILESRKVSSRRFLRKHRKTESIEPLTAIH
jgi:hypothetical protein